MRKTKIQSDGARLWRTLHRERTTWRADLRARHGERPECFNGVRVGDGWAGIVAEMLSSIAEIVVDDPDIRIEEIRSVNGMLKVSLRHVPPEHQRAIDDAIDRAGGHALCTCERCGKPGRIVLRHRRRKVACPEHEDPKSGGDQ